jgi:hypothetical protein
MKQSTSPTANILPQRYQDEAEELPLKDKKQEETTETEKEKTT